MNEKRAKEAMIELFRLAKKLAMEKGVTPYEFGRACEGFMLLLEEGLTLEDVINAPKD